MNVSLRMLLYTNSGYGRLIGQPGNVLLAFTVDSR